MSTPQKNPLFIFPADSFTENPYLRLISPRLQSRPLFTKTSRMRRALSRAFIKTLSVSYSAGLAIRGWKEEKKKGNFAIDYAVALKGFDAIKKKEGEERRRLVKNARLKGILMRATFTWWEIERITWVLWYICLQQISNERIVYLYIYIYYSTLWNL